MEHELIRKTKEAVIALFGVELPSVELQPTRKDFEGDITVVIFPMLRFVKGNPEKIGEAIGNHLIGAVPEVSRFNVIKGFLNLTLSDEYYLEAFSRILAEEEYGKAPSQDKGAVMVEYSSPNTNKPLHLGHIRNNLLGYSVAEILKASGKKVYKTQIINDRGIHICKSMLAWQKFGEGITPESSGLKGDKLVGNYYVAFDKAYKKQVDELVKQGRSREEAEQQAPILLEAQEMLRQWEAGDKEVVSLWKTMNSWVYKGFEETYARLGVDFDRLYYESDTYLLGKEVVEEGLRKGVFYRKDDGSVWIDLTEDGLDEKIVLRADGTAVYMTQDIGTAIQRVKDFPDISGMVYTVGNEQDYHFKVLFLILKKLGFTWADHLYHLSYGMVDLPEGKMKSREGTVVDADDLIEDMAQTAEEISRELGKLDGYSEEEKKELYRIIGLGALKYFILKVDPKKRILFNPEESVDFQGNTGPFIQYTYARIQSILRKANFDKEKFGKNSTKYRNPIHPKERELVKQLLVYPEVVQEAAEQFSPALIANYTYDLVKEFNSFYQQVSILGEEDLKVRDFRVHLSAVVAEVIRSAFALLGIQVPDRM
ncbi:arginyl-tRNA synthetase [Muriicola jejuensis]|uniref:Arginine--tRNA ligase n=1 Tax=Muriicola jejuensis TaxID=504488 RepID=A0A6P0UK00_9FLAO|nr:arginine--tRNA ligase [Muriicola jejuensis]NER10546.1 arginine--tRNA ligase [Muriicola jejuensis]SMP18192.1 arginyl-tRNA synthetase [Muriicola jejuensis]